jgi:hypothetical protein
VSPTLSIAPPDFSQAVVKIGLAYQFSIKDGSYFVIVLVHVRTHVPRDSRAAHADPALPVTPPSIELLIGELTAAAACLLAQAADEMESGRMAVTPEANLC